jgi:phosphoribosylaminoimidazole carboxylase PurE protein
MGKVRVAVVFGSDSDWPVMEKCVERLRAFGEQPVVEIMSAHRNPLRVQEFACAAKDKGIEVIIAGAGMSATLAGVISAHTTLPVIGVPLGSGFLQGLDALLATVQMPPGVPVASVGVGEAGAKNAALLAVQILALHDPELLEAYHSFKITQAEGVAKKNQALQDRLNR